MQTDVARRPLCCIWCFIGLRSSLPGANHVFNRVQNGENMMEPADGENLLHDRIETDGRQAELLWLDLCRGHQPAQPGARHVFDGGKIDHDVYEPRLYRSEQPFLKRCAR